MNSAKISLNARVWFCFALWLAVSMMVVAFDRHAVTPDKKCAICSMAGSLFSTVPQPDAAPVKPTVGFFVCVSEQVPFAPFQAFFHDASYRGPPL